jgi:hypothetical protein
MKIEDQADGKLITLSKAFDSRAKTLNVFYFVCFLAMGTLFIRMGLLLDADRIFPLLVGCIAGAVLIFAAYRFINKAMFSEKLFVNTAQLQIIESGLFSKKVRSFDLTGISSFRHLDKPALTDHPLAGQSVDYLGFQTEQKVISEMHGDKRIGFRYNGRDITFGENVYSWDFEELEVLLYDVTGRDLSYDASFEKTYKPEEEALD